jgi:hypothetical protein
VNTTHLDWNNDYEKIRSIEKRKVHPVPPYQGLGISAISKPYERRADPHDNILKPIEKSKERRLLVHLTYMTMLRRTTPFTLIITAYIRP